MLHNRLFSNMGFQKDPLIAVSQCAVMVNLQILMSHSVVSSYSKSQCDIFLHLSWFRVSYKYSLNVCQQKQKRTKHEHIQAA